MGAIIAAIIAAATAIGTGVAKGTATRRAGEEAKTLAEMQRMEIERQNRQAAQRQQAQDIAQRGAYDIQRANLESQQQQQQVDRSYAMNRNQLQDTLNMVNQNPTMRQNFIASLRF